jgi:hypothetical protein
LKVLIAFAPKNPNAPPRHINHKEGLFAKNMDNFVMSGVFLVSFLSSNAPRSGSLTVKKINTATTAPGIAEKKNNSLQLELFSVANAPNRNEAPIPKIKEVPWRPNAIGRLFGRK